MNRTFWILPAGVVLLGLSLYTRPGNFFSWPPSLDFTGGVRLKYRINPEDAVRKGLDSSEQMRDALGRCQEVFLFRLEGFDLSEISVKMLGDDQLSVEVPGTQAIERVKSAIGQPKVLTFRLVTGQPVPHQVRETLSPETRESYFRLRGSRLYYPVGPPAFTAEDINYKGVFVDTTRTEQANALETRVVLALRGSASERFARFTTDHHRQRLAICMDQTVETAPIIADVRIREPIISGYQRQEAKDLVKILRNGPLPISLDLVSETLISPTVGQDTLERLGIALGVGTGLILLFLLLFYSDHFSMLVTIVICLSLQAFCLYAAAKFEMMTLNMISLSGLVVLLGISVDNLILIFEEYRQIAAEERGIRRRDILRGFSRAFSKESAIVVLANVTTVLVLLPLYFFLGGPISDLVAVMTLGIFLALVINVWFARKLLEEDWFVEPLESFVAVTKPILHWRFPLFRITRPALLFYVVLVVASLALILNKGLEMGLDFRSGTEIQLVADEGLDIGKLKQHASVFFGQRSEVKRVRKSVSDSSGFRYVVRVARTEILPGEPAEPQGSSAPRGAEEFVEFLQERTGPLVRLESVDLLGPTVVSLNRTVIVISAGLGLLLLLVIIAAEYGKLYAIPVVAALALDGLITVGAISFFEVPLSIPIAAALLTIIGYSINDSIVLCGHVHRRFKELWENELSTAPEALGRIFRDPVPTVESYFAEIMESLSNRVLLTSLTTIGVALALWFFGRDLVRDFGLVISVGVAVGTLSSISLVAFFLQRIKTAEVAAKY